MTESEEIFTTLSPEDKTKMVNTAFLVGNCILVNIHFLILVILFYSFFPINAHLDLFKGYTITFHPNRQLFFYDLFILVGVLSVAVGLKIFSRALAKENFSKYIKRFLAVELFWVGLLFFLVFQMVTSGGSLLAKYFFYVALFLSFVSLGVFPTLNYFSKRLERK